MTDFDEHKLEEIAKRSQYKPHIYYDVEAGRWYASYKGWCVYGKTPNDAFDRVVEREANWQAAFVTVDGFIAFN